MNGYSSKSSEYLVKEHSEGDVEMSPTVFPDGGISIRMKRPIEDCPEITTQRPALTISKKHEHYRYEKPEKTDFCQYWKTKLKKDMTCSRKRAKKYLFLRLPILEWGLNYKIHQDLFNDVIAGVTVAVMNIPQGMAYAMLAGLDPIVGIYMAFFPVLIYAIFASSRHCSMGTFAVVCIMAGKVISELATFPEKTGDNSELYVSAINMTAIYSPVEVASVLSFAVGIWLMIFSILQLGSLSIFLSDMLVSGFTTGASIHVLTSQVPHLFGIKIPSYQGVLKIIHAWIAICSKIWYSNPTTLVISLVCFSILIFNNEILKPYLRKCTRIPFPMDLVVVVVGTLISTYVNLNKTFGVVVVGDIPTGLPSPTLPPFELYGQVLVSSLTIAVVSYTVSFSMAKIFAKRMEYNVDATQELYAVGLGNLMGSFFGCAPIAASLSRSLVQQSVGGATQLASLISCSLLVLVLLFIGPFFETLPNCILACIIAVALKGMFLQVYDVLKIWKISLGDALVWIVTFLGVIVLDIDYGLLLGILAALGLLIVRNQSPTMVVLGRVPDTDMYLDISTYASAMEIPGIKICQVQGNLHFANQQAFRDALVKTSGLDPQIIIKMKKKQQKHIKKKLQSLQDTVIQIPKFTKRPPEENIVANGNCEKTVGVSCIESTKKSSPNVLLNYMNVQTVVGQLIVDFSRVSQIDLSSVENLVSVHKEFESADISMTFAGLSENAMEIIAKSGASKELSKDIFFHSVPDAVAFLEAPPSSILEPPDSVYHF